MRNYSGDGKEGLRGGPARGAQQRAPKLLSPDELCHAHGLPLGSYEVLLFLAQAPGGSMRMAELADGVLLSRSGLTRMVDRLERDGLVRRERCESDARGYLAVITEAGRAAFRDARVTHLDGVRHRFLDRIRPEEQRRLGRLWERLA